MFSRDNDDAELMKHLKKGMWVKVRGSVQTDTFIRDLIVMANDINEIKKKHDRIRRQRAKNELNYICIHQ